MLEIKNVWDLLSMTVLITHPYALYEFLVFLKSDMLIGLSVVQMFEKFGKYMTKSLYDPIILTRATNGGEKQILSTISLLILHIETSIFDMSICFCIVYKNTTEINVINFIILHATSSTRIINNTFT